MVVAVSDSPMSNSWTPESGVEGGAILDKAVEHDIDIVLVSFGSAPDSRLVGPAGSVTNSIVRSSSSAVVRIRFAHPHHGPDSYDSAGAGAPGRLAYLVLEAQAGLRRHRGVTGPGCARHPDGPCGSRRRVPVDPGAPILFRQRRIGRDRQLFDMLKFARCGPLRKQPPDSQWQPTDRIYPLGKLMRKTSIDELPQLWNVLRGDMSIVGPARRPHFVEQFESSVPRYGDRHRVDVGLTGWAAVHGLRGTPASAIAPRTTTSTSENWSVWLDIKIIVRTVGAVLRGSGS